LWRAKIVEFGKSTTSNMVASCAAIRLLEGNIGTNTRALSRWLSTVAGVGPILQAAFPIVGLIVFAGAVEQVGAKVAKFFENMRTSADRMRTAFEEVNAPLRQKNAELDVELAKLQNDKAKLLGQHEDGLKVSLLEAHLAAMKLGEELTSDIKKVDELLQKHRVGFVEQILGGKAGTDDISKMLEKLQTGIQKTELGAGTDTQKLIHIIDLYNKALTEVNTHLGEPGRGRPNALPALTPQQAKEAITFGETPASELGALKSEQAGGPESDRRVALQEMQSYLESELGRIGKEQQVGGLKGDVSKLTAAAENAKPGQLVADALKQIADRAGEAQAKLSTLGKAESIQILAKASADSQREIDKLNKALEKYHTTVAKLGQEDAIALQEALTDLTVADAQWGEKLDANRIKVEERIASLNALTAAIGHGYEATKAANVQTQVATEMGIRYNEQSKEAIAIRQILTSRFGAEYEAQRTNQVTETIDKLQQQIKTEQALAVAETQGALAVQRAALNAKILEIQRTNSTDRARELIKVETDLFDAQQKVAESKELTSINQKIQATQRLINAQGQEARLAAEIATIRAEATEKHGPVVGEAAAQEAILKQQEAIHKEADDLANSYANQLDKLAKITVELQRQLDPNSKNLEITRALRDTRQEMLKLTVEEDLKQRSALAGVRAFFAEMQEQAKSAANIIYDAFNSVLDKMTDQLAKLATGQKTSFGKALQSEGEGVLKSSFKSAGQFALGEIGKHLGIKAGGKPTGTAGDPIHVIMEGQSGFNGFSQSSLRIPQAASAAASKIGGFLHGLGSSGGGAGAGAGASTADTFDWGAASDSFGGFLAGGGDVQAGMSYIVGDAGKPEIFTPKASGSVTPIDRIGGGNTYYDVDARGADLGAANRLGAVIRETHNNAVSTSVRADVERGKRTPQRSAA